MKYIPFTSGVIPDFYERDGGLWVFAHTEPREIYVADAGNHCIRRITVRQANVDTVAGVCGSAGFADGVLSVNKMDRPSMVGMDKLGNLFIFDSGNKKIRMMDTTGEVFTLLDGSCREDKTMPTLDPPFDLQLRGMVCYKR